MISSLKLVVSATLVAFVVALAGCATEASPGDQTSSPEVDVDTVKPEAMKISGPGEGTPSCSQNCSNDQTRCSAGCGVNLTCLYNCAVLARVCVLDCPIE